jgi:hypothetical protein
MSTASRQRQCHNEYAKANPVRRSSPIDDLKYDMTSVTLAQKTYVPLLMWSLVARVVKMDLRQRVNFRIKCLVAHTQSTYELRAVASPMEAVGH